MRPSPDSILAEARFATALIADAVALPAGLITRAGVLPDDRFRIYRNNVLAGLIALLRGCFPALEKLVGADFFVFMARQFARAHPPLSPVLMEYGGAMSGFLRGFPPVAHLPYLSDVAQLEWQTHLASHAADALPLDPAALAEVAPVQMASLCFDFHPSLSLLVSSCPVVSIWRANTGRASSTVIAADLAPESALILRPYLETAVHAITSADALFYARLLAGDALEVAASKAEPAFDLTVALTRLFRAGAITGFGLASTHQTRSSSI